MANLDTMEQEIYETLHALVSKTKIRHRVLTACRFHREKRYFFSERTFKFNLTQGRYEYRPGDGFGLPDDLVEILGSTLWWTPSGGTQAEPVYRLDRDSMDWERAIESTSQGEPEDWDWWNGALRLSPIPNDSGDTIEGPYVRDLGVPVKKYNTGTSAWEFYTPDGAATLDGSFGEGNHWFDEKGGYHLVKYRALYLCFQEILNDPERAQESLGTWLEERSRLEDETEGKSGPEAIPPSLF